MVNDKWEEVSGKNRYHLLALSCVAIFKIENVMRRVAFLCLLAFGIVCCNSGKNSNNDKTFDSNILLSPSSPRIVL